MAFGAELGSILGSLSSDLWNVLVYGGAFVIGAGVLIAFTQVMVTKRLVENPDVRAAAASVGRAAVPVVATAATGGLAPAAALTASLLGNAAGTYLGMQAAA